MATKDQATYTGQRMARHGYGAVFLLMNPLR